jgi:hypothetical protein
VLAEDLLGTETTGGDYPAKTYGTITYDGGNVASSHIRLQRRVVASTDHIGERVGDGMSACSGSTGPQRT